MDSKPLKFVHHKNCQEDKEMKNEILEAVWKIKDEIGEEHDFDIDSITHDLKKRGKKHHKDIVNY
jgi:hypothetical protein